MNCERLPQSGSPVISQETGKVIGTVAGSSGNGGRVLLLAPSYAILKALSKDDDFPLLRDVIGKKSAAMPRPDAPPNPVKIHVEER